MDLCRGGDDMEEIHRNSNYKSTWRPLIKEDDPSVISPSSGVETIIKNIEDSGKIAGRNEMPGQRDILKELAGISSGIDALNHMVIDQNEKIRNLLSLMDRKETEVKKSAFKLPWK